MKDNYDFSDLDAILAEFSGKGTPEAEAESGSVPGPGSRAAEPVSGGAAPVPEKSAEPSAAEERFDFLPEEVPAPAPSPAAELPPLYSREEPAPKPRSRFHGAPRQALPASGKQAPAEPLNPRHHGHHGRHVSVKPGI